VKFPVRPASEIQPLDKTGFIPLYYQIQQFLMDKIQSGALGEGDLLDSEEELARAYKVSRMTARQALHGLKARGYAHSQKGRGTFVTRPKLERNILHLRGFTEDMKQRGMIPSSRLLEQVVIKAPDDVVELLRLAPGSPVMKLRRVRLADGIPIAIEQSHVPLTPFPKLEKYDFSKESLYQILREKFGVTVAWADETFEALHATLEESELLTIPRRASILSITRIIITHEQTPIEVACSHYRGDRYRAHIRVPTKSVE